VNVNIRAGLDAGSKLFVQSYLRFSKASTQVQISESLVQDLLTTTDDLIALAKRASRRTTSNSERQALDISYQKLAGKFHSLLDSAEHAGINLLDQSDLKSLLETAGVNTDASTHLARFFRSIAGTDHILGTEPIKSKGRGSSTTTTTTVGDGTFQNGVAVPGVGGADSSSHLIDLDGDGNLDFVIADTVGHTRVSLGNGDGTFQGATLLNNYSPPDYHITLTDINGDSTIDLIEGDRVSDKLYITLGNGDGTFAAAFSTSDFAGGFSTGVGDFDEDGKADVISSDYVDTFTAIHLGNGDGTFGVGTTILNGYQGVAKTIFVADLNGDNHLDFINSYTEHHVFLGNGDGTFQSPVTYRIALGRASSPSTSFTDVTGDGIKDIVSATNDGSPPGVFVLPGNVDGTFGASISSVAGGDAYRGVSGDFNGDGKQDFAYQAYAGGFANSFFVQLGNGDGTFGTAVSYASLNFSKSMAAGDLNNDGVTDIFMTKDGNGGGQYFEGNGATTETVEDSGAKAPTGTDPVIQSLRTRGKSEIALETLTKLKGFIDKDLKGIRGILNELAGGLHFAREAAIASGEASALSSDSQARLVADQLASHIRRRLHDPRILEHSGLDTQLARLVLGRE